MLQDTIFLISASVFIYLFIGIVTKYIFSLNYKKRLNMSFLVFQRMLVILNNSTAIIHILNKNIDNLFKKISSNINKRIEDTNNLMDEYENQTIKRKEAEAFYVKLIQSIPQGVAEIDFVKKTIFFDKKMQQILKIENRGSSFYMFIKNEKFKAFIMNEKWQKIDKDFIGSNFDYSISSQIKIFDIDVSEEHVETKLNLGRGKNKWVSIYLSNSFDEYGNLVKRICSLEDITKNHQLRETEKMQKLQVEKSEEFLKSTQKIGKVGTFEIYIEEDRIELSDISADIIGFSKKIIVYSELDSIIEDEYVRKVFRTEITDLIQNLKTFIKEMNELLLKDKELFKKEFEMQSNRIKYDVRTFELKLFNRQKSQDVWIIINIAGYIPSSMYLDTDNNGKHDNLELKKNESKASLIGVILDNTERRTRESELEKAKKIAETSEKVKTRFFANLAHEIRTPLNSILAFSDLISNQLENKKHKNYFKIIYSNSQVMLELISGILDLTKMEEGQMSLSFTNIQSKDYFKESLNLFLLRVKEKKIKLVLRIDSRIPSNLTLDRIKFKQMISNMVSNSIKFTEKGLIALNVIIDRYISEDEISIRLVFYDTGKGVVKKNQKTIFEPYRQQENQDLSKYQGTGLGLSLITNISKLFGGYVEIVSSDKIGTVFSINLKKIQFFRVSEEFAGNLPYELYSYFQDKVLLNKLENNLSVKSRELIINNIKDIKDFILEKTDKPKIIFMELSRFNIKNVIKTLKKCLMVFVGLSKYNSGIEYPSFVFFSDNPKYHKIIKRELDNGYMFFIYHINKNHFSLDYVNKIIKIITNSFASEIKMEETFDDEQEVEKKDNSQAQKDLDELKNKLVEISKKDEKDKVIELNEIINNFNKKEVLKITLEDFVKENLDFIDDISEQLTSILDVKSTKILKKVMSSLDLVDISGVKKMEKLKDDLDTAISIFDMDEIDSIVNKFLNDIKLIKEKNNI